MGFYCNGGVRRDQREVVGKEVEAAKNAGFELDFEV